MKKLSLILLILTILLLALFTTSCESQETSELDTFDSIMLFIYGESDAANYFMNIEWFSASRSSFKAFGKLTSTIGNVFTNLWNNLISWDVWPAIGNFFAEHWLTVLLVWLGLSIVSVCFSPTLFAIIFGMPVYIGLLVCFLCIMAFLIAAGVSVIALLIVALYAFVSIIFDLLTALCIGLSIIIFGLLRGAAYVLVDLGWGEKILKNYKKFKDYV